MKKNMVKIRKDNPSIQKIKNKCIGCGMCFNVCENIVGIDHSREKLFNPICINCGQCVMNCPMASLQTKYQYNDVLKVLKDKKKKVSISIAPAVRVSIGDLFGYSYSDNLEKILPTLFRKLGFNYVFDITFGADVTIMEEASELLERIKKSKNLPMFTSCCPSWVKYLEMFHSDLIPNLSTCKSPIGMQTALINSYFKESKYLKKDIINVVVAPCTAKKYEANLNKTDYVITTQELALMIRESGIDIFNLEESNYDELLGEGSKCGLMFGRSGGVMESALNTFSYLVNKRPSLPSRFHIDNRDGIFTKKYKIGEYDVRVAVVYGLKNLEKILEHKEDYDFIEVMNCPNGCIGGGGQSILQIKDLPKLRSERETSINNTDKKYNYPYENKYIIDLYNNYLDCSLSKKSEKLLHTKYKDLSKKIK